jgi:hypothetical protein
MWGGVGVRSISGSEAISTFTNIELRILAIVM